MRSFPITSISELKTYLQNFSFEMNRELFPGNSTPIREVDAVVIQGRTYERFTNEYWTSRQRQASSLHEIAYRACFKAQLPRFFIKRLSAEGDLVYDPFSGRGTTVIEAALLGRKVVANDINPLSTILSAPRLRPPKVDALQRRLEEIPIELKARAEIDLSMFYHPDTEAEIVSLRRYLQTRQASEQQDPLDDWIRMVATNRLTGHSPGFFSVYTLPPNQAVSPERQKKINARRRQQPEYRDTKKLILKKSRDLLRNLSRQQRKQLWKTAETARFFTTDARSTKGIASESVQLTVTSPPFLDVVQYATDNWLRCWFNEISGEEVARSVTTARSLHQWSAVMEKVFQELYRITRPGGWVAFEVGEVRNGRIKLEEHIIPLGRNAGFRCGAILINQQSFTKTSNIWGIRNNERGTNSNRIVIFQKP